jgi:hypothetical protein
VPGGGEADLARRRGACRGKVERSYSGQSRNVRLEGPVREWRGSVNRSARGRAQADAQGRGDDGAGPEESIGRKPSAVGGEAGHGGFCVAGPKNNPCP